MKVAVLRALVFLDCVLNWITGGKLEETMSARAHRMRAKHQPYWWWLADAIDVLFGTLFRQMDHCHRCWRIEQSDGTALPWLPRWLFVEL